MRYLVYVNGRQVDSYYSPERAIRFVKDARKIGDQADVVDRYGSANGRSTTLEIE